MPRGVNTDYIAALGEARCVAELQKLLVNTWPPGHARAGQPRTRVDPVLGCWLYGGVPLSGEGYVQIKRKTNAQLQAGGQDRNAGVNFLIHRIAFVTKYHRDVVYSGSHLCDIPNCFNPDHIYDEDIMTNNNRKGCVGVVACPSHGHIVIDLCRHTPKCIRVSPPGVVCCLDRANLQRPPPFPAPPQASSPSPSSSSRRPVSIMSLSSVDIPPSSPPRLEGQPLNSDNFYPLPPGFSSPRSASRPASRGSDTVRLPTQPPLHSGEESTDSDPIVAPGGRRGFVPPESSQAVSAFLSVAPESLPGSSQLLLSDTSMDDDGNDDDGFINDDEDLQYTQEWGGLAGLPEGY